MRKFYFLIYELSFLMLKEIWQSTCTTLYVQKWLNQLLAFSYKSGDLGPLNGIMLGMFSLVQQKLWNHEVFLLAN